MDYALIFKAAMLSALNKAEEKQIVELRQAFESEECDTSSAVEDLKERVASCNTVSSLVSSCREFLEQVDAFIQYENDLKRIKVKFADLRAALELE